MRTVRQIAIHSLEMTKTDDKKLQGLFFHIGLLLSPHRDLVRLLVI